VSSSSGGGPSASLGGLWKLMSLSRPGHGGGSGASVTSSTAPKTQKPPKASRPPAARPGTHPSDPSAPFSAGSPTLAAPAATDPFHEHETPAPNPFSPPSGGSNGFDPGRPGGGGGTGISGGAHVSATPEPGSVLLLGTGLLGILGVMRKRRLI